MPLPTAAELTDPNATNTQMKERLGQLAQGVASKESIEQKTLLDRLKKSGENLLDIVDKTIGGIINTANAGEVTSSANWTVTDFISVQKNDIVQFNAASRNGVMVLSLYDLNKVFIKNLFEQSGSTLINNILANVVIDSANAGFIRFCYYHAGITVAHLKFVKTIDAINTSRFTTDIIGRNNIFSRSLSLTGFYINKNVLTASSSWNCSDYVAVDELTNYVSNASAVYGTSSNEGLGVHFYDSSKNLLGLGGRQNYNTGFTTPKNCAFIRFNFYMDADYVELYKGSVLPYTSILTSDIDNAAVVSALLNVDGSVTTGTGFSNWKTTDFIEVNDRTLRYRLPALNAVASMCEYDENKNFIQLSIQSYSASLEVLEGVHLLNSETKFIRVCYYFKSTGYAVTSSLIMDNIVVNEVESIGRSIFQDNDLSKKIWIALGDSITDHYTRPYTYSPIVAKKLNLNLIDGAYSGRRIRNAFIRDTLVTEDALRKAHVITIAHGTNDFKLETGLGAIGDTPTSSALLFNSSYTSTSNDVDGTFYADYKGVIEYIYSVNPNIRIMLITPIRRTQPSGNNTDTNDKGHKLIDYVNAIKAIADLYALPCLDNYNTSGFSIATIPTWTTDGLHPNEWAHENVLAVKIANFMRSN